LTFPWRVLSRLASRSILKRVVSFTKSASTMHWYGCRNPKLMLSCCISFLYCLDRFPLIVPSRAADSRMRLPELEAEEYAGGENAVRFFGVDLCCSDKNWKFPYRAVPRMWGSGSNVRNTVCHLLHTQVVTLAPTTNGRALRPSSQLYKVDRGSS
jgi:hypothetical protein